jgi:Arc/MetJ-type ribon-helix-helix transcriptional regulator
MPEEGSQHKVEVRVFVDGLYLKIIDDLVKAGYGTNRSEVVRKMIHDWTMVNLEKVRGLVDYAKTR